MYKPALKFDKDDPDDILEACTLATYENAEPVADDINLRIFPVLLDNGNGTWLCVENAETMNGDPKSEIDVECRQPTFC